MTDLLHHNGEGTVEQLTSGSESEESRTTPLPSDETLKDLPLVLREILGFEEWKYPGTADGADDDKKIIEDDCARVIQELALEFVKEGSSLKAQVILQCSMKITDPFFEDRLRSLNRIFREIDFADGLAAKYEELYMNFGLTSSSSSYAEKLNVPAGQQSFIEQKDCLSDPSEPYTVVRVRPLSPVRRPMSMTSTSDYSTSSASAFMESWTGGSQLLAEQLSARPIPEVVNLLLNELQNPVTESFKVFYGQRLVDQVFGPGSLFAVLWHEEFGIAGSKSAQPPRQLKGGMIELKDGEYVYNHIRRFVVVEQRRSCSLAISITTYSGRGLSVKKIYNIEHNAHGIVHDQHSEPKLIRGESPFTKPPVEIELVVGERLSFSTVSVVPKIVINSLNVLLSGRLTITRTRIYV